MNSKIAPQSQKAPISANAIVLTRPIKGGVGEMSVIRLEAEAARQALVPVDYYKSFGTCSDERERIGLFSGESRVEPRPSIFGGPNVFSLAVSELIGCFSRSDETGKEKLARATRALNKKGLKSGGHLGCAANEKFGAWMALIDEYQDLIRQAARRELGEGYDEAAMQAIVRRARTVKKSGCYKEWDGQELLGVLGDEANQAIEVLEDVDHEAGILVRQGVTNMTIDQTSLHAGSKRYSFAFDDPYAALIEQAVVEAAGMGSRGMHLARHAREVIIAAVVLAVPNSRLYEVIVDKK